MIEIFKFENKQVRFVGTADWLEWIAVDVGAVLEVQNIRQVLANFSEDEKGVCSVILLTNLTKEKLFA